MYLFCFIWKADFFFFLFAFLESGTALKQSWKSSRGDLKPSTCPTQRWPEKETRSATRCASQTPHFIKWTPHLLWTSRVYSFQPPGGDVAAHGGSAAEGQGVPAQTKHGAQHPLCTRRRSVREAAGLSASLTETSLIIKHKLIWPHLLVFVCRCS